MSPRVMNFSVDGRDVDLQSDGVKGDLRSGNWSYRDVITHRSFTLIEHVRFIHDMDLPDKARWVQTKNGATLWGEYYENLFPE